MKDEPIEFNTLVKKLRAAGAEVGFPEPPNEPLKKAFIETILDCPECRRVLELGKPV